MIIFFSIVQLVAGGILLEVVGIKVVIIKVVIRILTNLMSFEVNVRMNYMCYESQLILHASKFLVLRISTNSTNS